MWVSNTDIGKIGARALQDPDKYSGRTIDLVGDDLSCDEMLAVYSKVQGYQAWKAYLPSLVVNLLPYDFKSMLVSLSSSLTACNSSCDQWFFRDHGYSADVSALRNEFPDLLSFEDWLKEGSKSA